MDLIGYIIDIAQSYLKTTGVFVLKQMVLLFT